MKHLWKKATGLLLAGVMTASVAVSASAADLTKVDCSTETYMYTQEAHPLAGKGPINITEGKIVQGKKTKDIYLVSLHGTEVTQVGQAVDIANDLLSGFGLNNTYLIDLKNVMTENIPAGANIIFTGHSLGGMVAQQAAADEDLKERYNILYTVTFGSPLIEEGCEGQVNRLTDTADVVPYLSYYTLKDLSKQVDTRNEETMDGFSMNTHVDSYKNVDTWGDYDAVGVKGGNTYLLMDDSTTTAYTAPLLTISSGLGAYAAVQIDGNYYGVSVLF